MHHCQLLTINPTYHYGQLLANSQLKKPSVIQVDSDSEVEFVGRKRKEREDDEPQLATTKKKNSELDCAWPGLHLKLTELMIWCSKAPEGCKRDIPARTWDDCFAIKYGKRPKTAYTHRRWYHIVRKLALEEWAGDSGVTVKKAVTKFHLAFKQARCEIHQGC
ncbi:hypothetical protein CROQUDRAFT_86720 [Cronartium quercuum f. sp. fusiforme G11]|uniref:Uncharacterized protein n=1 Tax=Cronartium quercuum f. sp. fusiforme G11 TaxID=708437 RepID=A0A9P6THZ8_9BASI|nr:hypothetical protein CROQUDRAFT_86720 [Cronartium quercuum f. sp. fusiforme G11]